MIFKKLPDWGLTYYRLSFTSNGKALISGENQGLVKLIVHPGNKIVLGGAIVGPHATEMITELTIAVQNQTSTSDLAAIIHPHPTISESIMEAAFLGTI